MSYQPATVEIIKSDNRDELVRTVVRVNQILSPPIAPASLWVLPANQEKVLELHALVHRKENILTFETYQIETTPLIAGGEYSFISWWRPDQLKFAQDGSRSLHKRRFMPKDAAEFHANDARIRRQVVEGERFDEETLIKDGWDHEHCFLCWQTISLHEDHPIEGYTDGAVWVCEACYSTYIESGFGRKLGDQI